MNEVHVHAAPESAFRMRGLIFLVTVLVIIAIAAALKATYVVTMPLVYAFFLAMLVRPVQVRLNRALPHRLYWLALTITMMLVIAVIALAVGMIWLSVELFSRTISQYSSAFVDYWNHFINWTDRVGLPLPRNFFESEAMHSVIVGFGGYLVSSIWSLFILLIVIFFLTMLMLLEVADWKRKIRQLLDKEKSTAFVSTMDLLTERIRHYMFVQTLIGALAAFFAGVWLWVLGVDFALLWAILFFVLNYIPNIGPVLGGIPPVVMALVQFNFGWALLVSAGLLFIQQVMGNFIEPRLLGRALQLSPTFLVISIFIWGWIWGAAGAIAAVPIMVTILITFAHIPFLKPIALLLSLSVEEPVVDNVPKPET